MRNINIWLLFPGRLADLSPISWRALLIIGLGIIAGGVMVFLPPIAQDSSYHNFADQRRILGVPNLLNVISNAFLGTVGIIGFLFLLNKRVMKPEGFLTETWERWAWLVFFVGVELTALSSACYHLAPDNFRLFWDRLQMAIVFMALFAIIIAERISFQIGRWLFLPLLAVGIGSVIYWHLTEISGVGDLRPYIFVQFFPMVSISLMLLLFPARYTRTVDFFWSIGWYVVAKIFEVLDNQIFVIGNLLSGHTLKHLFSGLATYWLLRMLKIRRPIV